MKNFVGPTLAVACLLATSGHAPARADGPGSSGWVGLDRAGKLKYRPTPAGDRILDFSTAGYGGGGVAIPDSESTLTVRPAGDAADDAAAIQAAVNDVSARPLVHGHRGTVLLAAGVFHCRAQITLKASGVVLRGAGAGDGGSVLRLEGEPHLAISIAGPQPKPPPASAPTVAIADRYVPAGATTFRVASANGLHPGDSVHVVRPVTPAWLAFMGMDHLVRRGGPETWITGDVRTERTVAAVEGDRVTLDVPLTDSLDARYLSPPGATVVKIDPPPRIEQVGVESLRITAPARSVEITDPNFAAVRLNSAQDVWLRDLSVEETVNSVAVGHQVRRATVRRVSIRHSTRANGGAGAPSDFSCDGSQVLFDHCTDSGNGLFYFSTGAKAVGPIVLLNCTFDGNGSIQPHQRWSTGLLVDNCRVPAGHIELMDRGYMGSGHGWTIGWSVVWNSSAKSLLIQRPPGSLNWAIGCTGEQTSKSEPGSAKPAAMPQGVVESPNVPVAPASLYLAQLRERSGDAAVKRAGY